ncbi:MAG: hypothetical protein ABH877_00120 [bacterium]
MATLSKFPRKKQQIHTRLYMADVQEIKRRAHERGIPYQTYFRNFVHEALQRDVKVR